MNSDKIHRESPASPSRKPDVSRPYAAADDALLRAAKAHRARIRGPLAPSKQPFAARLSQGFVADAFEVAGTCRPSRLATAAWKTVRARVLQPSRLKPQQACAALDNTVSQSSAAKLLGTMRHASSFLGVTIGFFIDVVAIIVALVITMPGVMLHALWAARTEAGLQIDIDALPVAAIEAAYNETLCDGVHDMVGGDTDGVSSQLALDLPRQNMFVSVGPEQAPERLSKKLSAALPLIRALCADDAGHTARNWLGAVTNMSTQGLLNAVYAELTKNDVMHYNGVRCAPNLNGDTTYTLRRISADAVAVRAQVVMQQGLQVFLLERTRQSPARRSKTPLRLHLEVVVHKGQTSEQKPFVRVTELRFDVC